MKSRIWHVRDLVASPILALCAVLALSGFAGCEKKPVDPGLQIQLPYEPASLDFTLAEDGMSLRLLPALMVGLYEYGPNHALEPRIAEKMEKLDGGRKLKIRLRPWNWSDGKRVTAADFMFSFRRALDPAVSSKFSDLLFFIRNAKDFKRGSLKDFSKVGIHAVSDVELEILLEKPISFFPHILTLPVAWPQRKDVFEQFGPRWSDHMLSTGPYRLARYAHDQRVELEANSAYPGFDPDGPKRIVFNILPEETTAATLFDNGRLDIVFKAPAMDLPRLRSRGVIVDAPYFATYYLAFDQRQSPWNNRDARLAVAEAVNRGAILESISENQIPATSWIPKGIRGYNPAIGISFDQEAAKQRWQKAVGSQHGKPKLVFGFDTGARNQTIAEKLQSDFDELLGAHFELQNRDWKTYLQLLASRTPGLFRFGYLAPFVDAYPFLAVFVSDSPNNYTGWKNADYDKLVGRIAELDAANPERQKLIDRAQKVLLEENAVVIPIYHYNQTVAVAPRVKGFAVNGMGEVNYQRIRLQAQGHKP